MDLVGFVRFPNTVARVDDQAQLIVTRGCIGRQPSRHLVSLRGFGFQIIGVADASTGEQHDFLKDGIVHSPIDRRVGVCGENEINHVAAARRLAARSHAVARISYGHINAHRTPGSTKLGNNSPTISKSGKMSSWAFVAAMLAMTSNSEAAADPKHPVRCFLVLKVIVLPSCENGKWNR